MTLMMKLMLCSYHSHIHDLMKAKATGVEPPIAFIVSGFDYGLTVVPGFVPAVLPKAQAGEPPIIQLWPEG